MKYLKYFKTDADCQSYLNSDDFVMPNVSYAEDADMVYCNPIKSANSAILATYLATDDNKLAIANTSNVKSLKVNGDNVSFDNKYYFESNGEYEVEIELIDDSVINGVEYDEDWNLLSFPMFVDLENYIGSCLTSITIPDSVTSIGGNAFESCYSLKSITISDSVISIGDFAFSDCAILTSINIPDSIISIGDYAFQSCCNLTSITIPESVTEIGEGTFAGCEKLTSFIIPDSVTSIGRNAFSSCYSLKSITIPDSVISIGEQAFMGCESLPVENDLRYADTYLVMVDDSSLSTYTIKEGTKWIGSGAFAGCSGLTSIDIPDSVTSIGESAFHSCSGLTSVNIPDSVASIGNGAFGDCESLTSVNIPDSVTSIGEYAFYSCPGLTLVTIGNSVTSIGGYAFQSCRSLNEIICLATTAPTIESTTFNYIKQNGILKYPSGSNYSSWMSTDEYYLGYYNWTSQEI